MSSRRKNFLFTNHQNNNFLIKLKYINYKGVIIEKSLENKDIFKDVKTLVTKVGPVIEKYKTPWLKQWALHTVEVVEEKSDEITGKMSKSLDSKHGGLWYTDFKNEKFHYVIFRNKVFKIDLSNPNTKTRWNTALN